MDPRKRPAAAAAGFDQLHETARAARDETAMRRLYSALTQVRDPALSQRAADITLSDGIPPQAADLRLQMAPNVARGMESARCRREEKYRLVGAADRTLGAHAAGAVH